MGLPLAFLDVSSCVLGGRRAACERVWPRRARFTEEARGERCVYVSLWTVQCHHLVGVVCGVSSLTERGRVDCAQSSLEQVVVVMVRCCNRHVVDYASLMCLFFYVFLWVNFHGIGTCFDVVNVQSKCFLLCRRVERVS